MAYLNLLYPENIFLYLSIIPMILIIRMKRALSKVSGKFTTFERLLSIEVTFKTIGIIKVFIAVN